MAAERDADHHTEIGPHFMLAVRERRITACGLPGPDPRRVWTEDRAQVMCERCLRVVSYLDHGVEIAAMGAHEAGTQCTFDHSGTGPRCCVEVATPGSTHDGPHMFKCAAPACPGYQWPASVMVHPYGCTKGA